MATLTAKKSIDWQFPNENQTVTADDFKQMVRDGENAPHISYNEFCHVTDEWLSK